MACPGNRLRPAFVSGEPQNRLNSGKGCTCALVLQDLFDFSDLAPNSATNSFGSTFCFQFTVASRSPHFLLQSAFELFGFAPASIFGAVSHDRSPVSFPPEDTADDHGAPIG